MKDLYAAEYQVGINDISIGTIKLSSWPLRLETVPSLPPLITVAKEENAADLRIRAIFSLHFETTCQKLILKARSRKKIVNYVLMLINLNGCFFFSFFKKRWDLCNSKL